MFRKTFIAWHDSTAACIISAVLMLCVSLFSVVGIGTAVAYPDPWIIWVPILLLILSTGVFTSLVVRLLRRRALPK